MSPTASSFTRHALIDTDIGALTVVHDDDGLAGIYFPGHWTKPKPAVFGTRTSPREFAQITEQLHEYFAGRLRAFDVQLAPAPSPRAERMRAALCALPYGATASYGELARTMGITAREVGALNAHNPVSIVVPCHRVIGADAKLVGYAGGLERKVPYNPASCQNACDRWTQRAPRRAVTATARQATSPAMASAAQTWWKSATVWVAPVPRMTTTAATPTALPTWRAMLSTALPVVARSGGSVPAAANSGAWVSPAEMPPMNIPGRKAAA